MSISQKCQSALIQWYDANKRDLPWRKTKDPYAIWISEVMLQQTTSRAVWNYFEKFLEKFPTVQRLSAAKIEDVYEVWAGLGYYSRARNLHKASQVLASQNHFPTSHRDLLELPGFGPYTARSVASLAFLEDVGVVDGNVIRFLSRYHNLAIESWTPKGRSHFQKLADKWVARQNSSLVNQALMEIGAQICTPQNPKCGMCPLTKTCSGRKARTTISLPLRKPRKTMEQWIWTPHLSLSKLNTVTLVKNDFAPFLKDSWILPGPLQKVSKPPEQFLFKHTITHRNIYVQNVKKVSKIKDTHVNEVNVADLARIAPSALLKKVITHAAIY